MSNNSIWLIDRSQSSFTTTGRIRPGSSGNEEELYIPQRSKSLLGGGSYLSAEVQSVYSTVPGDWADSSMSILVPLNAVLHWDV